MGTGKSGISPNDELVDADEVVNGRFGLREMYAGDALSSFCQVSPSPGGYCDRESGYVGGLIIALLGLGGLGGLLALFGAPEDTGGETVESVFSGHCCGEGCLAAASAGVASVG